MEKIETQLTLEDFIKVNMYFTYRKFSIKLFTGIGALVLLIGVFNLISFLLTDLNPHFPIGELILGIFFTFGLPLFIYWNSKKNYKSNARLKETINYSFNEKFIEINGESFSSQMSWDKTYKVTESKDWVLLWQNRQVANIIPKKYLDETQLEELKALILGIPGLKTKLKK